MIKSGIDLFALYTIVKRISTPFTDWTAYKVGLIDDRGNILVDKQKRSQEQRQSLTYLDIFVLNLKKLLQRVPGGNNKFVTYAGALWLLKEDRYISLDVIVEDGDGGGTSPGNFANTSTLNVARSSEKQATAFSRAKKIIKRNKTLT